LNTVFFHIFYRSLIVNGLFGIADEENNVEYTSATPEFSYNMEAEKVYETTIDKIDKL